MRNLTDAELSALVAEKVMGHCAHVWAYKPRPQADPCPTCGEDRSNAVEWEGDYPPQRCTKCGHEGAPNVSRRRDPDCKPYATDIAAAWEVVEKIRDEVYWWTFTDCQEEGWLAQVMATPNQSDADVCVTSGVCCQTLPRSICLAALQAVGWEG